MGDNRVSRRKTSLIIAGLAALAALAFDCEAARASVLNSCTTYCHGMPPRDGARKGNPHFSSQSSAFLGNHRNHLSASPVAAECGICHTSVAATDFGHQNDVIAMANSLKGYSSASIRAQYDKGRFFNQTSIPNLAAATCSNASCHFETKTPAWGSTPFAAPANCNACHGFPPSGTTVAPAGGLAGSHVRHNTYFPGSTGCQKCHPGYASFSHASSVGRPLKVQGFLRDPANTLETTATYSGSGSNYLPSASGLQVFGSCTNLYCHSNSGPNGTARVSGTPVWASSALTCAGCHADMATTASTAPNGSHYSHASTTYGAGAKFVCAVCHGSGYTATTITPATHVNRQVELGFTGNGLGTIYSKSAPIGAGTVWGNCATSLCHGSGVPVWGGSLWSATDQCGKCHSSTAAGAVTQAVPFYSTPFPTKVTLNTDAKVGAHTNHMTSQALGISASTVCTDCHGSVTLTGATHMNGSTTFAWSILATGNGTLSPLYSAATRQCTATYCHGNSMPGGDTTGTNKSPIWNDPAYLPATLSAPACGTCHGFPPSTVSGHPGGITIPAGFPATAAIGTSCNCHSNINAAGNSYATMFINPALHINGIFEPAAGGHVFPYSGSQHLSAAGTTPWGGCTGCHTNAAGGSYPVAPGTPPNCTGCHLSGLRTPVGTSSCWDCHGTSATDGKPNGGAFPNYSGSHTAHVTKVGLTCANCHFNAGTGTTTHGNSNRTAKTAATVAFNGLASTPVWTSPNCTAACHSAARWGGRLRCIDCHNVVQVGTHGTPRAAATTEFGLAWGHKKAGRGAVSDADCIVCHLEGDFATQVRSAKHGDGNIDLRNPDGAGEVAITNISGAAFTFKRFSTSYAAGSRTATGHLSNTDIANVITQKFCLACHDSNGATNPTARSNNGGIGTAAMPFGGIALGAAYTAANNAIGTQGLIDVKTQTATTFASAHPVQGPRSRAYPTPARFVAPYNGFTRTPPTKSNGVVINCFDCHNTPVLLTTRTIVAHGNAVTLRGNIWTNPDTLCTACHIPNVAGTTDGQHGVGSAFASGTNGGMQSYINSRCEYCHSSSTPSPGRPLRAQDVHGFDRFAGTGTDTMWPKGPTDSYKPYTFMRNTVNWAGTSGGWKPLTGPGVPVGSATCGGNVLSSAGCTGENMSTYTPGGSY